MKTSVRVLIFLGLIPLILSGCIISQTIGCNLQVIQNINLRQTISNLHNNDINKITKLILYTQQDAQNRLGYLTNISTPFVTGNLHCLLGHCKIDSFSITVSASRKIGCLIPDVQETPGYTGFGSYVYNFIDSSVTINIKGATYVLGSTSSVSWDQIPISWEKSVDIMSSQETVSQSIDIWVKISSATSDTSNIPNWNVRIYQDGDENHLISQFEIRKDSEILIIK